MSEKGKENKVNQEEIPDEEMENEEGQDGQDDGGQGEGIGEDVTLFSLSFSDISSLPPASDI